MDKKSELEDYVQNCTSRKVAQPAGLKVDFHFHGVEEWLEVLSGSGTFYSINETDVPIDRGDILHIPQGEVHLVDVGEEGLLYQMYIPTDISPSSFSNPLDRDELRLLLTHFNLPSVENGRDSDRRNGVVGGYLEVMLEDLISDGISFRNAAGKIMDKKKFLGRDASNVTREIGETADYVYSTDAGSVL